MVHSVAQCHPVRLCLSTASRWRDQPSQRRLQLRLKDVVRAEMRLAGKTAELLQRCGRDR